MVLGYSYICPSVLTKGELSKYMEQVENKKKILIVDDEPNVRRLLHTILGKTFDVLEAEDGETPQ